MHQPLPLEAGEGAQASASESDRSRFEDLPPLTLTLATVPNLFEDLMSSLAKGAINNLHDGKSMSGVQGKLRGTANAPR